MLEGHQDSVKAVAFSPNGTRIVSGSDDCTVRVWNAVTFKQLAELKGHQGEVTAVAFSYDSIHIVSGSNDHTVRVWNAVTLGQLAELRGNQNIISSIAFSRDNNLLRSRDCFGMELAWICTDRDISTCLFLHYCI
jgi:WD40 repeat protein